MPITYGTFTRQLKLLPLTLHADGSATVVVRYGYVGDDAIFIPVEEKSMSIGVDAVSEILDAQPTSGMTRRDDLALTVYQYLVTQGLVEAGTVS